MGQLWRECLDCKTTCCNHEVASRLFVTPEEFKCISENYPDDMQLFNSGCLPCSFFTDEHLCRIHTIKPIDCRLFPFDLLVDNGKVFWIIREINCQIVENEGDFEEYLSDFEENIIPNFEPYLEPYALFRFEELAEKFSFRVLRELRIRKSLET
jgi:Fe-S-cluster containining protein